MIRFVLSLLLVLQFTQECHANMIRGASERYPLQVKLMNNHVLPQAIEVCSKVSGVMTCEAYPKMSFHIARQANFSWDHYLDRCSTRVFANRFIFGAKVFRSIMILAGAVAAGAVAAPALSVGGAWQAGNIMTGMSGGVPVLAANMTNIMGTPSNAYPTEKMPTFPTAMDQAKTEEPLPEGKIAAWLEKRRRKKEKKRRSKEESALPEK